MKKKVVITGGSGFIGSSLIAYLLKKDFDVLAIIRSSTDKSKLDYHSHANVKFFVYDNELSKLVSFFNEEKPMMIIHLASFFVSEHSLSQINNLVTSNITFGLHLLEAMKASGVLYFINTGTSWQHYKNEEYNPVCLYAATKKAFEDLIEYYVQAEGFKVYTLKLFDTYGKNDHRPKLIKLLNEHVDAENKLELSPGLQKINLVHIADVCDAFLKAIRALLKEEFPCHQKYAIKHQNSYSIREIVEQFENITGKKMKIAWGAKIYRRREVMEIWENCEILNGWEAKISIQKGIESIR